MSNAEAHALVLKSQTGDYFLVSQETLERGRVPAEQTAELERQLAEAADDDVQGHIMGLGFAIGWISVQASKDGEGPAADLGRQAAAIGTMGKILSNAAGPQ